MIKVALCNEVLRDLLGLDAARIEELRGKGAI